MTQLLISVKNVEEALHAMYAGTSIVDLKDPAVGSLGALPIDEAKKILAVLEGQVLTSATVGEGHVNIDALLADIKQYADIGVDIIKIAVTELFMNQQYFVELQQLTVRGIKLVAVFFADKMMDLSLITKMQTAGFYGAMIDTQQKCQPIVELQSMYELKKFTEMCKRHHLISGLAGSVGLQHLTSLIILNPDFIGMRGGVCDEGNRTLCLSQKKVEAVNAMLLKYNTDIGFGSQSPATSLQI
ncbi:MAG: (5-formylfuran-3-yl)methyl phosphate synthase [Methylotenera sp.]